MKAAIKSACPKLFDTFCFLFLACIAFFITSRKDSSVIWQFYDFINLTDEHRKVMSGFILMFSCYFSSVFCFVGFLVDFGLAKHANLRNKSGDK